jgi:hypothetical protein
MPLFPFPALSVPGCVGLAKSFRAGTAIENVIVDYCDASTVQTCRLRPPSRHANLWIFLSKGTIRRCQAYFLTSPRARALTIAFELQAVIQFDSMDTSGCNFFQFEVASSHLLAWASNWEVAKTGHSQKPAPGSLWIGWHPGKVD